MQTVHGAEADTKILLMNDEQNELGYVVIDIKASTIRMLKMEITGCMDLSKLNEQSRICADSMLRASASYAATVGAYQIESRIAGLEHYLYSVGFIESGDRLLSPLSNFVKIGKC